MDYAKIAVYLIVGTFFFTIIAMAVGLKIINTIFKKQNSFLSLIRESSQKFKKAHPDVAVRLYFLDKDKSAERHRYYLELKPSGVLMDSKVDQVAKELWEKCNQSYAGVDLTIDDRPVSVSMSQNTIIFATDTKTSI